MCRDEKFHISSWLRNVLSNTCIQNITFHLNTSFFAVKGAFYHVAIATVILSRVKITRRFMCKDIMFLRKSSLPGISLPII